MKDLYSMDRDQESLDQSYQKMIQAYKNIYARCGLPAIMVEADSGAIGGKDSHEFMVITETGEDDIICCPKCEYAANSERAIFTKPTPRIAEAPLTLEEVATPGAKTIEEVARFLGIEASQTLKAVFYAADGGVIFALIRGDLDINEVKLKNVLKCNDLRLATDAEVTDSGLVAGFASPVGISGVRVVADDSITLGANFVVGANKADAHFKNANYPRDFQVDILTDIALAKAGDQCPHCDGVFISKRGIEVGHLFKLGTVFSQKLEALYLDQDGEQKPIIMGCYGIGIGRLLAAAVEQNHDEKGIIWPLPIAPYHVYLCALSIENDEVAGAAEKLYRELEGAGVEVLFDDRAESPGVKFNDADLLGIPIRVVISPRGISKGEVEIKLRSQKQAEVVPLGEVRGRLLETLQIR